MSDTTMDTKRGRKPTTITAAQAPEFTEEGKQDLEQQVAMGRQIEATLQASSAGYRLLGQIEAFGFMRKTVDVSVVVLLRQIKESKHYKGLQTLVDGKPMTVSTWDEFCRLCVGRSQQHVDEDIRNLSVLGEEFMEASQKMGLSYRELRQLRAIPEEERGLMYLEDGKTLRSNDPEVLKDWVEEALAKNAKTKEELEAARADLQAQGKVLETKNKALDTANTRLAKLKSVSPDDAIILAAEKEAKGREDLAALGAEALTCFGKFLAVGAGIQADRSLTHTAAQSVEGAVSSLCSSMAELLVSNGFQVDFESILFPEWMSGSQPE